MTTTPQRPDASVSGQTGGDTASDLHESLLLDAIATAVHRQVSEEQDLGIAESTTLADTARIMGLSDDEIRCAMVRLGMIGEAEAFWRLGYLGDA